MNSIILDENKDFLIIGSSGQEKQLTQNIVDKYNSIAINRTDFNVDIIFRVDRPKLSKQDFSKCRYFLTHQDYKKQYENDKCRFFDSEYKIISKSFPVLGCFRFSVTAALNFIAIKRPQANVYLVGIDHNKGGYKDPTVKRFIERYKDLLNLYQTDFNSEGWNLEYRKIQ